MRSLDTEFSVGSLRWGLGSELQDFDMSQEGAVLSPGDGNWSTSWLNHYWKELSYSMILKWGANNNSTLVHQAWPAKYLVDDFSLLVTRKIHHAQFCLAFPLASVLISVSAMKNKVALKLFCNLHSWIDVWFFLRENSQALTPIISQLRGPWMYSVDKWLSYHLPFTLQLKERMKKS